MRPVKRNNNPAYQVPAEIQIANASVKAFFDWEQFPRRTATIFYSPAILKWMADATAVNMGAEKWTKLVAHYAQYKKGPSAIKAITYLMDNVFAKGTNTAYGNARLSLIQNFGQYCSYCGMPVYDSSLAVEHVLPKASFPDQMMCYPNFLVACPICNSIKNEQPSYSQSLKWWKTTNPLVPKPSYTQIKDAGQFDCILPDDRPNNINAYAFKAFTLSLWQYVPPFNQPIADTLAYDLRNYWLSTNNNKVTAAVWDGNNLVQWEVFTQYAEADPAPKQPYTLQRAKKTIDYVGLNRTGPGDDKMTDRRNINRTVAFFEAITAYVRLQIVFTTVGPGNVYDLFCNQVFITARLSGFYEIWINVLGYLCQQPASKIPGLYGIFKADTCDPAKPYAYFTGTDASRLP